MTIENLNVFVLEDEEILSSLLTRFFTAKKAKCVDVAENEKEAINLFSSKKYDVFILDTFDYTGAYGIRVLAKSKELNQNPKVIIATSGKPGNESLWEKKVDFLQKPYSLNDLIKRIEENYK